ncbi:cytochrome c oxidase assembly protein subunit 15 [Lutibacter oricola]|uniref:Cytochrome c oxidase assembly protein subunit 15 n=1 Tax=Lutibacter oricola TaxID=762486 RepID=A0A1H2S106_9FLAO|nr:COX15/CtaA family protein [Lutibacter oricola]SDW25150.1 cytochrome c oxidase assembly protein subunit 15 [Lutibacter oricola]
MKSKNYKYSQLVRFWLLTGLIMLIGQVILGGITRLTGSGLSITRWDIITGVIPPLNTAQWLDAFELYKQTPQFHKINSSFTLEQFKFIYFWEYFHRLWVRSLGFIFLIPFIWFLLKKKIDFYLVKRLLLVVFLTVLTASAGWIMVQSGLVNRPWVNAYKLTVHFVLAIFVVWAMVKTIADVYCFSSFRLVSKKIVGFTLLVTIVQMVFAGLMAGMKAGLYYPTWPTMNGEMVPEVLKEHANYTWANMINYDSYLFAPALIQFTHRLLAYILVLLTIYMFFKFRNKVEVVSKMWLNYTVFLVLLQTVLGVLTVLNVKGEIPLFLGVAHQLVGLLYFISLLFFYYSMRVFKA